MTEKIRQSIDAWLELRARQNTGRINWKSPWYLIERDRLFVFGHGFQLSIAIEV